MKVNNGRSFLVEFFACGNSLLIIQANLEREREREREREKPRQSMQSAIDFD